MVEGERELVLQLEKEDEEMLAGAYMCPWPYPHAGYRYRLTSRF